MDFLKRLSEKYVIKGRFQRILTLMYTCLGVSKLPYCHILTRLEFRRQIFQIKKLFNFFKIRLVGVKLFSAGGQRDTKEPQK
jgi:hypothetical protein